MSLIVEFRVERGAFALGRVLEHVPAMEVELERVVPSGNGPLPLFWAWGDEFEALESAAAGEPAIERLERIGIVDDTAAYRVDWDPSMYSFTEAIRRTDATILRGGGSVEGWHFELRFGEREHATDIQSFCLAEGIEFDVLRVGSVVETTVTGYGLTDAQREALVSAQAAGYFAEPRETTTEALAEEFGISPRALSGRIRRDLDCLVRSALTPGPW